MYKKRSSNPQYVQEKETRETENKEKTQKAKNRMADLSSNISLITLNVNDLNTPIRGQDWQSGLKNMT